MRKVKEQRREALAEAGGFLFKSGFFSRLKSTGQGANSISSFKFR